MRAVWLVVLAVPACADAWAQPRPGLDAGVRRDAGAVRDAGAPRARRDAGAVRDAGVRDASVALRPPTHGRVDAQAARQLLATRNDAVRRCYAEGLNTDATLHGEITVRLRVEPDGRVSEASSGGDPALLRVGRCIEEALRTLRFPQPTGGAATVAAPFVFQPGG